MTEKRFEINIPREIRDLPLQKRAEVAQGLMKALNIPSQVMRKGEDIARNFVKDYNDHMNRTKSIWQPHDNQYVSDLEDAVYSAMAIPLWNKMLDLFDALGLTYPTWDNLSKSLSDADERNAVAAMWIQVEPLGNAERDASDDTLYEYGSLDANTPIDVTFMGQTRTVPIENLFKSDGYQDMDDINRRYRKDEPRDPQERPSRRTPSAPYRADGGGFTDPQLQTLDNVLKRYKVHSDTLMESIWTRGLYLGHLLSKFEEDNERLRANIVNLLPVTLSERRELDRFALTQKEADKLSLPLLPLQKQEENAILWAEKHAGEKIGDIDEKTRNQIRAMIVNARRNRVEPKELEQMLFDKFGDINRDMRRIALTEVAEATNNGYLMGLEHGQAVTILGADNACKFCKAMQAGDYVFVDPASVDVLDWDKMLWVGKSNYGRASADWKPCAPAHPHCRDRYQLYNPKFQKVDKDQRRVVLKNREEIVGDALKAKLERDAENPDKEAE